MSNVIDFLERLGRDPQLRDASDGELEQALIQAQIDPAIRDAILMRDQRSLERLIGASPNVCCMIYAPAREDEDEEEDDKKQQDDGDEGEQQARRRTAG